MGVGRERTPTRANPAPRRATRSEGILAETAARFEQVCCAFRPDRKIAVKYFLATGDEFPLALTRRLLVWAIGTFISGCALGAVL
jgi:hypothetical protein